MTTGSVIIGNAVSGCIVVAPVPTAHSILSMIGLLLLLVAMLIASRREPAPVSAVVVTVKVAGASRSSRDSSRSWIRAGLRRIVVGLRGLNQERIFFLTERRE